MEATMANQSGTSLWNVREMVWGSMPEYKLTPSEIKARDLASKQKPKKRPVNCIACAGTGEIRSLAQHAARCPECLGSGFTQQSKGQQLDGSLFARSTY
jgi:DnaJ-class molecular chaperone